MEFKGTKGEWKSTGLHNYIDAHIKEGEIRSIARVYHSANKESEYNAKLIAAAPELLEALQVLVNTVNQYTSQGSIEEREYFEIEIEEANKAIKKALE